MVRLERTVQVVIADKIESGAEGGSRTARSFGQRILSLPTSVFVRSAVYRPLLIT